MLNLKVYFVKQKPMNRRNKTMDVLNSLLILLRKTISRQPFEDWKSADFERNV